MATNAIQFLLGNELRALRNVNPNKTVLNYLRYDEGLTGTKEGCAEGDCGACTVVLGERRNNSSIRYRAVNSCVQFLPTLHGKQLITVEHLSQTNGRLHPVQQAMVENHGSQCGFCTPGFVMSLFALYHENFSIDRETVNDTLAGNLCRCTGYAPIVKAAMGACQGKSKDSFSRNETKTSNMLKEMSSEELVSLTSQSGDYFAPSTCSELETLLAEYPHAVIVAGATDVGLWVTKQHRRVSPIIYIGNIGDLKNIRLTNDALEIGAMATYSDAVDAINQHYPDFGELIRRLGSVQIRNVGTIGGNIANGSPIGDMPPGLIAANARLILRSQQGRREIPLEAFFIEYGKQDLQRGEFVEKIVLPQPPVESKFRTYKVSKRFDQDISAVCGAYQVTINNGVVSNTRICYGGMAGIPRRATHCEKALNGSPWNDQTIETAMQALEQDYQPLTDMRASEDYRMHVAKNLLYRFYLETSEAPKDKPQTRLNGKPELAHA